MLTGVGSVARNGAADPHLLAAQRLRAIVEVDERADQRPETMDQGQGKNGNFNTEV